jgi:hypothetical protein
MARALKKCLHGRDTRRIAELGAGDGHFLLSVAQRLRGSWPDADATLVDRLDALDPQTRDRFLAFGWRIQAEIAEATEWLQRSPPKSVEAIVGNLFFHQFGTDQLAEMLRLAAQSAHTVVALEPRRTWLPRLCGRLLWLAGCGPVTCHDGPVSIRAGFAGRELSALWPDAKNWELIEHPVGLFSHLFITQRKD